MCSVTLKNPKLALPASAPSGVADLLITDASSVSSEYSLLDRPMVFLDVPDLIQTMEAAKKGRMDLDTWGRRAGLVARWPDEAVEAVERSLENPEAFGPIRRAMARDLFYGPGTATDRAEVWVLEELGIRPAESAMLACS